MFREGTALEALESADSRRFLPQALAATLLTIAAPALVVVALSPLSGAADVLVSALLATGLSVVAGSAGAALWTRLPQSHEIPFADLMLWSWARRVRAERRLRQAVERSAPDAVHELGALRTLAVVFEARDGFSHGHSGRVARHAERVARRMGLPADEVDRIEAAAAVHDVGMLAVPRAVLAKAAADRSPDERTLVERHVVEGAQRLAKVAGPQVAAVVRHHHERYDGAGYPDGLAGEAIPVGARIVAVADRFDELVSPGRGEAARGRRNALDELRACAGTELDPAVVGAFVAYYSSMRTIAGVALAATAPQRVVRWLAAAPGATIGAASAPVALQGMCAAGATVLAGACLAGLPALSPERDGSGDGGQRAAHPADGNGGGNGVDATKVASTLPGDGDRAPRDRGGEGGDGGEDGGGRGGAGGDGTPAPGGSPPRVTPAPDAGTPTPGSGGGGGTSGGGGGSDGSGGTTPATPSAPAAPQTPAPQPPSLPQPQANPVSQVVDPALDGVSEALPPVKPVTDAVKGVVGGLTGGLTGGNNR